MNRALGVLSLASTFLVAGHALAGCVGDDPRRSAADDAGATADGGSTADASDAGTGGVKLAFVTNLQVDGKLGTANGGVGEGDAVCNGEAKAASRTGTFHAFLSTSAQGALARIGPGPWVLTDGSPIPAREALVTTPSVLINRDAKGAAVPSNEVVWTGTGNDGKAAPETCANWGDTDTQIGVIGYVGGTGATWMNKGTYSCNTARRLYCFED